MPNVPCTWALPDHLVSGMQKLVFELSTFKVLPKFFPQQIQLQVVASIAASDLWWKDLCRVTCDFRSLLSQDRKSGICLLRSTCFTAQPIGNFKKARLIQASPRNPLLLTYRDHVSRM